MDDKNEIARSVIETLGIAHLVRSIVIEKSTSPWSEKAFIKWKKDHLDVKLFVWDDTTLLYGRIHRLFLYVYDVMNPAFEFKPRIAPDEEKEPRARERYNQVWSIYVDSRMERQGIPNFYDRQLRHNLFIDSEKDLSWEAADAVFDALWSKEFFTYPEIIDYAYDLSRVKIKTPIARMDTFEREITDFLREASVKKHIDRLGSPHLRDVAHDILNFAAYHCTDSRVESKYYGIVLIYQRRPFLEMIPTNDNRILLTLFDGKSHTYETQTVTETSDVHAVQALIKERYKTIAIQNQPT